VLENTCRCACGSAVKVSTSYASTDCVAWDPAYAAMSLSLSKTCRTKYNHGGGLSGWPRGFNLSLNAGSLGEG